MNNVVKVVGFKKGETRKGTKYTVIYVEQQFAEYEVSNVIVDGVKATDIYIPKCIDVEVNKWYQLVYTIDYMGRAQVDDIFEYVE